MKLMLFGSKGMLGSDLCKLLSKDYTLFSYTKEELDITDSLRLQEKILQVKPEIVINCAAYTNVEGCESNFEQALEVNANAVREIAKNCKQIGAILIQISTDYVFDGCLLEGYKENDKTNPLNKYGITKLKAEKYIQNILEKHYIVRSSWLFGKNGKNFVRTIINLLKVKEILSVVDDQRGCPTYTEDLSKGIKELFEGDYPYGIYHINNKGNCSWYRFALEIANSQDFDLDKVVPVTSKEYPTAASRPKCSILLNTKHNIEMRFWKEALKAYLLKIKKEVIK